MIQLRVEGRVIGEVASWASSDAALPKLTTIAMGYTSYIAGKHTIDMRLKHLIVHDDALRMLHQRLLMREFRDRGGMGR